MLTMLKKCCFHSATGIILGFLALVLMADTFYLNQIRDQKAETLETAEQSLEAYQTNLQSAGNPGSLKPYLQRFRYGSFLKATLGAFQESNNALQITEIHVEETDNPPTQNAGLFPRPKSKKNKTVPETRLTLRGQIRGNLETEAPYQQLNEILGSISQETGCTLQLFKGTEAAQPEAKPSAPENDKFQFELQLEPQRQKSCWQRYTQGEVDP
jgi:hypothetical protein